MVVEETSQLSEDAVRALRRAEFPGLDRTVYLDTSAIGVPPRSAVEEGVRALRALSDCTWSLEDELARREQVRQNLAQIVGCRPDDLALLKSTGEGLNLVASGLPWSPGDEVLLHHTEYPTGIVAWTRLRRRGVQVAVVPASGPGFTAAEFERCLTPRTRVLSVSSVGYTDGFTAPLEDLATLCQTHGVLFVVDAMQSVGMGLGAIPTMGANAVAAGASKYLLSGIGGAIFYVSPDLRDRLEVASAGWLSLAGGSDPSATFAGDQPFVPTAARFEGAPPTGAVAALMSTSSRLLLDLGLEGIGRRIAELTNMIVSEVENLDVGADIRHYPGSPIVSIEVPERDSRSLVAYLATHGVRCSARGGRIRISAHFYNTREDILLLSDRLSSGVRSLAASGVRREP